MCIRPCEKNYKMKMIICHCLRCWCYCKTELIYSTYNGEVESVEGRTKGMLRLSEESVEHLQANDDEKLKTPPANLILFQFMLGHCLRSKRRKMPFAIRSFHARLNKYETEFRG